MDAMKTFLSFLRPHWRDCLLAPLLMALEVACDLSQPWCLSRVVDQGIRRGDMALALRYSVVMFCLALLGAVGGMGCTVFASRASAKFGADLRAELYAACLRLSFLDQTRFPPSTLLNRLSSDVAQLQNIVLILLRILVRAPLLTFGGIAMILVLDPVLGARFLWPLPILAIVLGLVIQRAFPLFAKVQLLLDAMAVVVRENLSGVRVVKAFVRHREEIRRFESRSADLAAGSIRAQRTVGGSLPLVQLLLNLSMVALIWAGGLRELEGRIPLGQLMAMVNYLTQILFSLMMSAMMLMTATRGKASIARVREILDAGDSGDAAALVDPKPRFEPRKGGNAIAFRSVSFRYPDARADCLSGISFEVGAGETLGILGPTGAGKSTLIALLLRFSDPRLGRILVDGMDLRERDLVAWRRSVGWVGQNPTLFSGTVRDNIRWGDGDASEEEIREAARIAQADSFVRDLADGYDTLIGQRGVNLSGGQRQRATIARALVRKPSLLILDDSTSALDGRTERRLREALASSVPGATRIVVAQRIASVADADRILLLDQGRVAGFGRHVELLEENELYRDIWRSQTGSEVPVP
jgi:ATP-binding cassette subfamily B multidrug efflux pump